MPKALLTTKSGAHVTLEGTKEDIVELLSLIEGGGDKAGQRAPSTAAKKKTLKSRGRPTLNNLVSELLDGSFFKKPKELGAIRLALQEQGHFYPATTLSPVMLRMVRRKQLRRIKDNNRWLYVG